MFLGHCVVKCKQEVIILRSIATGQIQFHEPEPEIGDLLVHSVAVLFYILHWMWR
jgi:hypothetical protein